MSDSNRIRDFLESDEFQELIPLAQEAWDREHVTEELLELCEDAYDTFGDFSTVKDTLEEQIADRNEALENYDADDQFEILDDEEEFVDDLDEDYDSDEDNDYDEFYIEDESDDVDATLDDNSASDSEPSPESAPAPAPEPASGGSAADDVVLGVDDDERPDFAEFRMDAKTVDRERKKRERRDAKAKARQQELDKAEKARQKERENILRDMFNGDTRPRRVLSTRERYLSKKSSRVTQINVEARRIENEIQRIAFETERRLIEAKHGYKRDATPDGGDDDPRIREEMEKLEKRNQLRQVLRDLESSRSKLNLPKNLEGSTAEALVNLTAAAKDLAEKIKQAESDVKEDQRRANNRDKLRNEYSSQVASLRMKATWTAAKIRTYAYNKDKSFENQISVRITKEDTAIASDMIKGHIDKGDTLTAMKTVIARIAKEVAEKNGLDKVPHWQTLEKMKRDLTEYKKEVALELKKEAAKEAQLLNEGKEAAQQRIDWINKNLGSDYGTCMRYAQNGVTSGYSKITRLDSELTKEADIEFAETIKGLTSGMPKVRYEALLKYQSEISDKSPNAIDKYGKPDHEYIKQVTIEAFKKLGIPDPDHIIEYENQRQVKAAEIKAQQIENERNEDPDTPKLTRKPK